MTVRLIHPYNFAGGPSLHPGSVIVTTDEEAARLIEEGWAVPVVGLEHAKETR